MFRPLALLLALLPAAIQAQSTCPTAADLTRGIRVDRSLGYTEVFRSAGPGVISVEGTIDRQREYDLDLAGGLQVLRFSGNTGNSPVADDWLDYDYGLPATAMPQPVPNGRWQSEVTVTGVDGAYSEPQLYAYGPLQQINIGGCDYGMITVIIAYKNDTNYIETLQYLPELGISVLVQMDDDTIDPISYTIDRIGVARK